MNLYSYFTTEDILFLIIKPKLDKIVKDQYGKEMLVNPMKVQDVAVMRKGKFDKDNPNIDSWIEVRMSMMVGERKPKENFKMDTVVLKIDAPNIGGNANKPHLANGKIDGIQVDLVEYYKNK